jgi:hypothetical protein
MISSGFSNMRTWAFCLIAYCVSCTSAVACVVPTLIYNRGIFFERIPTDIDAPIVIEATIYGDDRRNELLARVDRVIKGSIDTKYLKIAVARSSCPEVGVGIGRGIILGTLRNDPPYGVVLAAIQKANAFDWSKEFFAEQVAIDRAKKCSAGECRVPGIGPESTQP